MNLRNKNSKIRSSVLVLFLLISVISFGQNKVPTSCEIIYRFHVDTAKIIMFDSTKPKSSLNFWRYKKSILSDSQVIFSSGMLNWKAEKDYFKSDFDSLARRPFRSDTFVRMNGDLFMGNVLVYSKEKFLNKDTTFYELRENGFDLIKYFIPIEIRYISDIPIYVYETYYLTKDLKPHFGKNKIGFNPYLGIVAVYEYSRGCAVPGPFFYALDKTERIHPETIRKKGECECNDWEW